MSQQGNRPKPLPDTTAACMCGDEGPNNERCDVCGYTFTIFRKPKPRGVKLNDGGFILDEEYDPLSGWCYCGKTGIVGNACKRCHYEFTNDPNLLTREFDPLEKWEKTGQIHRIANSPEENSRDNEHPRLQNMLEGFSGFNRSRTLGIYYEKSNWQLKYGPWARFNLASRIFWVVLLCAMVLMLILIATSGSQ